MINNADRVYSYSTNKHCGSLRQSFKRKEKRWCQSASHERNISELILGKNIVKSSCFSCFCCSEGGTSVWTLMMSPLAKDLFHAAVDMSGSYVYNATLEQAESDNLAFLNKTGCRDPTCLRRLPVKHILQVKCVKAQRPTLCDR